MKSKALDWKWAHNWKSAHEPKRAARQFTPHALALILAAAGCATDGEPGAGGVGAGSDTSGDGSGGFAGENGTGQGSGASTGTGASSSSGGRSTGVGGGSLGSGGSNGDVQTECNDGVDNDGDGFVDYAFDPGCYGPGDSTESAGARAEESGFTTFEFGGDSVVVYVSEDGDDLADGATPETAVRTVSHGAELVRDGAHDFLLLRRGDTWRGASLGRFKSGKSATEPLVIGSYGASLELPRLEVDGQFINHDGQSRSHVALLDLHLVAYRKDPSDPDFDGATGGGLRYVGNGSNLLIEGCHFEYTELILQSFGDTTYQDIEVRGSVFEKAYHVNTCAPGDPNGNADFRPSGIYGSHIDGLLLEGNVFDHNGWNGDVQSACATIYNHNVYLNGNDVVIKDNVFSRASSMHVKLRSDETGDITGTRIFGNYFVEGEIGISIGGNTTEPDRFVDGQISGNVFSDIGRSRPTTRTLAWGIEVADNDGLLIADNYFLNQREPGVNNSYAISISAGTARDVGIEGNLFYRIQNRSLSTEASSGHEAVTVSENTFVDPDRGARLIVHGGSFDAYDYSNNRYFSSANDSAWFGASGNVGLLGWISASGESGAEQLSTVPNYTDPERSIETYAQSLGVGDSLESYLVAARLQSRLRFDFALSAPAINEYIRGGFEEE